MNWQTLCDPASSGRLCLVLVHSLWQVAALAAVAWCFDRLGRRRSVQGSYAVHVVALMVALAAMPITYALVAVPAQGVAVQSAPTVDAASPAAPPTEMKAESPAASVDRAEPASMAGNLPTASDRAAPAAVMRIAVESPARWPRVAPWIAAAYVLGVLVMLVRLLRAIWHAHRLACRAEPIADGPVAERLRALAHGWSMRVVPVLARAEEIVVPKVVGLVRPAILLPVSAIAGLAPDELEMILAHELAHVRRHDMWVNLVQRLAEVVLFFNPALWYLSRRTSTLREYCCDELTCRATSGTDAQLRARYASALLRIVELAKPTAAGRRHAHPVETSDLAALAAAGRTPSELRRRVARLFGEPLPEPVPLSRGGLLTLAVVAAVVFTAPTAWRTAARSVAAPGPDLVSTGPAESDVKDAGAKVLRGKVIAQAGKGVAGADVWLSMYCGSDRLAPHVQHVQSDSEGRFMVTIFRAWIGERIPGKPVTLWAYAPGHQLGIKHAEPLQPEADFSFGDDPSNLVIALKPATDTSFMVLDPAGNPLADAMVQPFYVTAEPPFDVTTALTPGEVLRRIEARTDAAGRAKLPAVDREALEIVRIASKDYGLQNQTYLNRALPAEIVIRLRAVGRIEGRLTAEKPEWARGVRLELLTVRSGDRDPASAPNGWAAVESDDQGRFVVPHMASGKLRVFVAGVDESLPVRPQVPFGVEVAADATTELRIPMVRLVPVRGSVRVKGTDTPVAGVAISVRYGDGEQVAHGVSDSQGRFTVRVLPGPVRVLVIDNSQKYLQPVSDSTKSYRIPDGTEGFTLPPVELLPRKTVVGFVIDQGDKPVAKLEVSFVMGGCYSYGRGESDASGRFEVPGVPATLDAVDAATAEFVVRGPAPLRESLRSRVIKTDPLTIQVEMPRPAKPAQPRAGAPGDSPPAPPTPTPPAGAGDETKAADKQVDLAVVVAKHVLLLDGKEIITWEQLEKRIAAMPDPSLARPTFYTTRGAHEAGLYPATKDNIWRLHEQFRLKGHSEGSLGLDADFRYDRIKTAADLAADASLRVEGRVVDGKGEPVADAEVLLLAPVNESIPHKWHDVVLVEGRVRNPLEHVMTRSDDNGQFALYPPKDVNCFVVGLHPAVGLNLMQKKSFCDSGTVQLLPWTTLTSWLAEEARREASLRMRVRPQDALPEFVFNQFWGDQGGVAPTGSFRFARVPPIFDPRISLPGESRRLDLGPLSDQQREELEGLRKESARQREKPPADPKPAPSSAGNNGNEFELLVVGPDGKPIAGVTVAIRTRPMPTAEDVQRGAFLRIGPDRTFVKTDDKGRLAVRRLEKPKRFAISIEQPGFGPYWAEWGSDVRVLPVPSPFTAELDAAWTVGGAIVDADGKPIEGVNVRPSIKFKKRPGDFEDLWLGESVATDADGRWNYPSVPVSMKEVFVAMNHPDYEPLRQSLTRGEFGIEPGQEPKTRITLRRGLAITGAVKDESGRPIAGAVVRTKFLNDLREATTGPEGNYRLVGCERGMARIVVSAPGKARDFQDARVEPDMRPVDFTMKPGGKIRVRVLDSQGNPVAKTRIFFQRWRGPIEYFEFNGVNEYTDASGAWQWDEAPLDEIKADICPPGGMQLLLQPLLAGEKEHVFRLFAPLVISGDVTDATSGKPVRRFRVVPGIRSGEPDSPHFNWARGESFEATDGHYELRPNRGYLAHVVRIEADGYEVADSRDIKSDEDAVRIDFKLKPAADVAATVLTPTGEPAAGAKIALGIAGSQIDVTNGDIDDGGTYAARQGADDAGRFRFPAQGADFQLVITHPSGFAYLKSADGPVPATIRLTPWARVEGTFRVGQQTSPNVGITLDTSAIHSYGPDVPNIFASYDVTTDAEGRFTFERVFPGDGWIGRRILLTVTDGATEVTSSKKVAARFVAGETTQLDLGGTGIAVTGKLSPPADFEGDVLWNFALVNAEVDLPQPKSPPVPADVKDDPERRKTWWDTWKATDDGKAWQAAYETYNKLLAASPRFTATVGRDGAFRIDDVPPGKYVLNVRFSEHPAGRLSDYRFTVPETGAESRRPMDLGIMTLQRQ